MNKAEIENFIQYFKGHESFTTEEIHAFFSENTADIKRATVNWRVHVLVKLGILKRKDRGVFSPGKELSFIPTPENKQSKISLLLKKQFPLIKFCSWHSQILKEFYHHIAVNNFIVIEVERDSIDSVF